VNGRLFEEMCECDGKVRNGDVWSVVDGCKVERLDILTRVCVCVCVSENCREERREGLELMSACFRVCDSFCC